MLFLGAILLIPRWFGGNQPTPGGSVDPIVTTEPTHEECEHDYVNEMPLGGHPCTDDLSYTSRCKNCGHRVQHNVPAPGHNFVDGICTRCGEAEPADCEPVPDDFAFSITFNVYGISSYDSETGRLVKTNDPANSDLEKYATTLILSDEQMEEIYRLLSDLDFASYPTDYSPTDASSKPPAYWELTVQMAGDSHQVCCSFLPAGPFEGRDEKAQAFIDTFERICEIITSTEEWKSLPDPEVLYA